MQLRTKAWRRGRTNAPTDEVREIPINWDVARSADVNGGEIDASAVDGEPSDPASPTLFLGFSGNWRDAGFGAEGGG